jgi:hypothetical protein
VTTALAFGLVAQGLIAAAAVRILCDLLLRPNRNGDAANASQSILAPAHADGSHRRSTPASAGGIGEPAASTGDLPRGTVWAVMAVPLVMLVPLGACTLAEHMRGIWGDPSVTTCALLALFVARPAWLPARLPRRIAAGITMLIAVPLYGPILGLTLPIPDLYATGWSPYALLIVVAAAGVLMRISGRWCGTWATIIALGLMMYAVRAMESSNLIDYLCDPGLLLAIAAIAVLPPNTSRNAAA